MKITLFLMTLKGLEVLKALVDNQLNPYISEVIVGRDKFITNDFAEDIIALCKQNDISYFERADMPELKSAYSMAVSWKWLIPIEDSHKLIIFHDSLLPKYRGFAPLVNMLINKESEIGVSAIFAVKEYDRGEIIAQSSTPISYPIKIKDAIDLITKNYTQLAVGIFSKIVQNVELTSTVQNEELATYSLWRNEDDYLIDWNKDAEDVLTLIDAVSEPYKGASTYLNHQKIRILDAEIYPDVKIENRDAGKVIFIENQHPIIVCGKGLIKLNTVIDDESGESMLPFNNFRVKLSKSKYTD